MGIKINRLHWQFEDSLEPKILLLFLLCVNIGCDKVGSGLIVNRYKASSCMRKITKIEAEDILSKNDFKISKVYEESCRNVIPLNYDRYSLFSKVNEVIGLKLGEDCSFYLGIGFVSEVCKEGTGWYDKEICSERVSKINILLDDFANSISEKLLSTNVVQQEHYIYNDAKDGFNIFCKN